MLLRDGRSCRSTCCCSARATRCRPTGCASRLLAGAGGFKLHEDWGSTPAAIDACLRVADETGVQVAIHTDTLNEAGYVQSTLAAIGGRTIHAYHTEGAGGGHAPDIIAVAGAAATSCPSSTNPTRPHTVNTRRRAPRHADRLPPPQPADPGGSRVRREPHPRHDDRRRGRPARPRRDLDDRLRLAGDGPRGRDDRPHLADRARDGSARRRRRSGNERLQRYVAKYTICPAIAHGIDHEVGSVEVGKLADLVLWDPAFFAIRPRLVIKGGAIAYAPMGDANASIPTPAAGADAADVRGRRPARRAPVARLRRAAALDVAADLGLEAAASSRSRTRAR